MCTRFGVFALGSSAYPNFCAFGYHIDSLFSSLGGERIAAVTTGDELNGQEQAFKSWAPEFFKVSFYTIETLLHLLLLNSLQRVFLIHRLLAKLSASKMRLRTPL